MTDLTSHIRPAIAAVALGAAALLGACTYDAPTTTTTRTERTTTAVAPLVVPLVAPPVSTSTTTTRTIQTNP